MRKILGLELLPVSEIPIRQTSAQLRRIKANVSSNYTIKSYKVNKYITLKLDWNTTNIYINDAHFSQCKYLLLNIPIKKLEKYEKIKSIDEAAEILDNSLEGNSIENFDISPETEFWGHCSNIQAWVENDYDNRILHRNIAFTLLRRLTQAGDNIAKKVFKDEIAYRLEEATHTITSYLIEEGYLKYFNSEELKVLTEKNPRLTSYMKKTYN